MLSQQAGGYADEHTNLVTVSIDNHFCLIR